MATPVVVDLLRNTVVSNKFQDAFVHISVFWAMAGDKAPECFVAPANGDPARASMKVLAEESRLLIDSIADRVRVQATLFGWTNEQITAVLEPEIIRFFLDKVMPLSEAKPRAITMAPRQREFWTRVLAEATGRGSSDTPAN